VGCLKVAFKNGGGEHHARDAERADNTSYTILSPMSLSSDRLKQSRNAPFLRKSDEISDMKGVRMLEDSRPPSLSTARRPPPRWSDRRAPHRVETRIGKRRTPPPMSIVQGSGQSIQCLIADSGVR
jgi:hypothetical protein